MKKNSAFHYIDIKETAANFKTAVRERPSDTDLFKLDDTSYTIIVKGKDLYFCL